MRFSFHPEADREFNHAVEYYEQRGAGPGLEFAEEVFAAISRIVEFPDAWTRLSPNTKRCVLSRFPYGIIFQVKGRALRIIAVAHLHRRPGYWKDRV